MRKREDGWSPCSISFRYLFSKNAVIAAIRARPSTGRAARAAVDRIPRGERGGAGRKELGGWKGNHSPPLSGVSPLFAKAGRQLNVRAGHTAPLSQL